MDKGVLENLASDPITDKQRRGRVGREAEGIIYCHLKAGSGRITTPYPSWTSICRDEQARDFIFKTLNIKNELEEYRAEGNILDKYVKIKNYDNSDIERSLIAIWLLRCETGSIRYGNDTYDRIARNGWTENEHGVRNLLLTNYSCSEVIDLRNLMKILSDQPFTVTYKGHEIKAECIKIQRNEVTIIM